MQFIESRGNDAQHPLEVDFTHAVLNPIASFGGLYVPQQLPALSLEFLEKHLQSSYTELALAMMELCETGIDSSILREAISLYNDFDESENPVPVVQIADQVFVCELYHGPTRAFKDMALQPFGVLLSHLAQSRNQQYLILVATSGDTGPAALDTFRNKPGVRVVCMYPDGGTSDVQRLQMVTETGDNLKVFGIDGNFDDAQSALKRLLGSQEFKQQLAQRGISTSAANSVNFGRIIFQMIYHVHAYLELVRQQQIKLGELIDINVPSGNFGNALGGYYAMQMGLPIEHILISSNRNNVLTRLIQSGRYDLREMALVNTSSPAMDILKSSNIERVLYDLFGSARTRELMQQLDEQHYYALSQAELEQLQAVFRADFSDDAEVLQAIRETHKQGYLLDPHTATCLKTNHSQRDGSKPVVVYSTAEWTKFSPIIAEAIADAAGLADQQALEQICEISGLDLVEQIAALFEQPVSQADVIPVERIESQILSFLDQ